MSEGAGLYQQCADELSEMVERPFEMLAPLATAFAGIVASHAQKPGGSDLAALDLVADALLEQHAQIFGCGVLVQPGTLSDHEHFLQWRQRQPDGSFAHLLLEVGLDHDDPYDYPQMEWFRVPCQEGRPMVAGPYFDYRGNERYTLTLAIPVRVEDRFIGVAGCDVVVSQLESDVLPILRRIPARAALLNHERRVVTANAPSLLTGERVPLEEYQAGERFPVAGDQGWCLAVLPWPSR